MATIYEEELFKSVVTFHLPENMQNYIATLVNRIKVLIGKDLRDLVGSAEPNDIMIQAVLASAIQETPDD